MRGCEVFPSENWRRDSYVGGQNNLGMEWGIIQSNSVPSCLFTKLLITSNLLIQKLNLRLLENTLMLIHNFSFSVILNFKWYAMYAWLFLFIYKWTHDVCKRARACVCGVFVCRVSYKFREYGGELPSLPIGLRSQFG